MFSNGYRKPLTLLALILALLLVVRPLPTYAATTAQSGGANGFVILFGQDYTLESGEKAEDVLLIGGSLHLGETAHLIGDAVIFGGVARVDGTLHGDLVLFGGSAQVNGEVLGNVVVMGSSAEIGPQAVIHGNVQEMAGSLRLDAQATIMGQVFRGTSPWEGAKFPLFAVGPSVKPSLWVLNAFLRLLMGLLRVLVYAALAALLVLLAEAPTRRVGQTPLDYPLESGGLGLLTTLAGLALAGLLAITLIGLPLAVLVVIALILAWLYGKLALGAMVGERLAQALDQNWPAPLSAALGMGLLQLVIVGADLIPCVGWVVGFAVGMLGLGAVVLTRGGTQPYRRPSTTPETPPPLPPESSEGNPPPPEESA